MSSCASLKKVEVLFASLSPGGTRRRASGALSPAWQPPGVRWEWPCSTGSKFARLLLLRLGFGKSCRRKHCVHTTRWIVTGQFFWGIFNPQKNWALLFPPAVYALRTGALKENVFYILTTKLSRRAHIQLLIGRRSNLPRQTFRSATLTPTVTEQTNIFADINSRFDEDEDWNLFYGPRCSAAAGCRIYGLRDVSLLPLLFSASERHCWKTL